MTSADGLPTMTTFTGKVFDFSNPQPEMICIEDIAHALSLECRFANQSKVHYSVAQHSVLVERFVEYSTYDLRRIALLHDAAEAYMGDVNHPLKQLLPEYKRIEDRVHKAIAARFSLAVDYIPNLIKEADNQLLANEGISFMSDDWHDAKMEPSARIGIIQAWTAREAEKLFMERYTQLFT